MSDPKVPLPRVSPSHWFLFCEWRFQWTCLFFRIEATRWLTRTLGALAPSNKWWPRALGLWSPPFSVRSGEVGRGQLGTGTGQRLEATWSWGRGQRWGPERSLQTCPSSPVTPLDVVKVRLQSQRPSMASGECLDLEPRRGLGKTKISQRWGPWDRSEWGGPSDLRDCLVF